MSQTIGGFPVGMDGAGFESARTTYRERIDT